MKRYMTISEAAREVQMTSETLRHYDRIGLVHPSRKDPDTGYRYYSDLDLVLLNTIRALRFMDVSLKEIKEVLNYDDLDRTIDFFRNAETRIDERIDELHDCKAKILSAKTHYEKKAQERQLCKGTVVREFPERVIMLSDTLRTPTVENLWNYLSNFYRQLEPGLRDSFAFEDLAGIYTQEEDSRLFALCMRYRKIDGLKTLPAGKYLCTDCSEENRAETLARLEETARKLFHADPQFSIQQIVLTGIIQWNYQIQIPLI